MIENLKNATEELFEHVGNEQNLGVYKIEIAQKAQRKKRIVELEVKAKEVTLKPPKRRADAPAKLQEITLRVESFMENRREK